METTQTASKLSQVVENYEKKSLTKFTPEKKFYLHVGINRIRFWQLVRGEKPIFCYEAKNLAEFFGVEMTIFIN